MNRGHYQLWSRCRAFVGKVCEGRDATHGLGHMEKVTQTAIMIHAMECSAKQTTVEFARSLARVILVGMLHDVNDHKYDKDNTLTATVTTFADEIVKDAALSSAIAEGESVLGDSAATVIAVTGAISYSKEKKNGMRWFEKELGAEWTLVRDIVSDADKMDAIGEAGLHRCFHYNTERVKGDASISEEERAEKLLPANVFRDVQIHSDEKLLRLTEHFIVTEAGKFLAKPLHEEMEIALQSWATNGLPKALA